MRTLVVVATREPHRQAEGLRAALGLTLRGADVVAVTAPPASPLAERAIATLLPFGHRVETAIELDADAVEIWTGPDVLSLACARPAGRRLLHLVRGAAPPEGAVANDDTVVYLSGSGPDHDQLVALVFAHDLVVTW